MCFRIKLKILMMYYTVQVHISTALIDKKLKKFKSDCKLDFL